MGREGGRIFGNSDNSSQIFGICWEKCLYGVTFDVESISGLKTPIAPAITSYRQKCDFRVLTLGKGVGVGVRHIHHGEKSQLTTVRLPYIQISRPVAPQSAEINIQWLI